MFRVSLAPRYIPQGWKVAGAVFILKPGRSPYAAEDKTCRPISLTSIILKTLEKPVEKHIRRAMIPLNISQGAYQSCKCYESAQFKDFEKLTETVDILEVTVYVRKLDVFLDID